MVSVLSVDLQGSPTRRKEVKANQPLPGAEGRQAPSVVQETEAGAEVRGAVEGPRYRGANRLGLTRAQSWTHPLPTGSVYRWGRLSSKRDVRYLPLGP